MVTIRENYLRAIRRQEPAWVPWYSWFTDGFLDKLQQATGHRDDYAQFFQYPWKSARLPGQGRQPREAGAFLRYYRDITIPPGARIDGLGVLRVPGSFLHFERMVHPMRDFTTVREVEEYPWPELPPEPSEEEIAAARTEADALKAAGWPVHGGGAGIFETGWSLRGLQSMLMDLMTDDPIADAIFERLAEYGRRSLRTAARIGVDVTGGGDDVGMQDRMMMDPELWRRKIKPHFARIFSEARAIKPDIHIGYHSDGYIEPIIPDLIEIGVDILNPIQPECMDQKRIKREYGRFLCLDRCVGTQTVLPFWTPEQIDAQVKWTIRVLGRGGGLIIGPTHTLEPDVPWGNFVAFYRAVMKYGGYESYPGQMPTL